MRDSRACPGRLAGVSLMRILQKLGVRSMDLCTHGTGIEVRDVSLYPWVCADFAKGLDEEDRGQFSIFIDFSKTLRIPGAWAVRGSRAAGCTTFREGCDMSRGFGSTRCACAGRRSHSCARSSTGTHPLAHTQALL